jgi:hypothetical protein
VYQVRRIYEWRKLRAINLIRYRIGVINDFRNATSFIDCKCFKEELTVLDCSYVKSEHRGFAVSQDEIVVFLNFRIVGRFKSKQEARRLILKLIEDAPIDISECREYLLKDIGD